MCCCVFLFVKLLDWSTQNTFLEHLITTGILPVPVVSDSNVDHWGNKLVDVGEDKEENLTEMMAALAKKKGASAEGKDHAGRAREARTTTQRRSSGKRWKGRSFSSNPVGSRTSNGWPLAQVLGPGSAGEGGARELQRFAYKGVRSSWTFLVEKKRFKKKALRHRVVVCQVLQLAGDRT